MTHVGIEYKYPDRGSKPEEQRYVSFPATGIENKIMRTRILSRTPASHRHSHDGDGDVHACVRAPVRQSDAAATRAPDQFICCGKPSPRSQELPTNDQDCAVQPGSR